MQMHPLQKLVSRHKNDSRYGIYSVCSSNPFVIEAAISLAKEEKSYMLIESTSNQVDQFGGYTGMKPNDFIAAVQQNANALAFETNRIIFGGDHLGPNVWQGEKADAAMKKAAGQIEAYVNAGYTKIHLDTSMACADDPKPLPKEVIAQRAAFLCKIAEETYKKKGRTAPVYVIGTEVPVPGGAAEELNSVKPTPAKEIQETIELTKQAFENLGLADSWKRVVAVVAQPGVEFSNTQIVEYDNQNSKDLALAIQKYPKLIYEAHSTDYQTQEKLGQLVHDHFGILKVGPALTFAFREAIFALANIEKELFSALQKNDQLSRLVEVTDIVMLDNPRYWEKYYPGHDEQQKYDRHFGLSDRIRYYWSDPRIKNALDKLINNLVKEKIPLALLSQFLPQQYKKVRNFELGVHPKALICDKIKQVLQDYSAACNCKNNYALLTEEI